jgi:acyl-ACP thioesterase
MRPGLADCAPSGRARLDAIARWLQDIAYADVEDAGLQDTSAWVVRRSRLSVERFPRFAEHLTVRTFCSGLGRMWAERRTTVAPAGEPGRADVDAVSLWVHLDRVTGRPAPLTDAEIAVYGPAAERRVRARLHHPPPDDGASESAWRFRATECDLAGHVNNAAYWETLEEELLALAAPEPERIDAEIEFRSPSQPGEKRILTSGPMRWIVDDDGEVNASVLLG